MRVCPQCERETEEARCPVDHFWTVDAEQYREPDLTGRTLQGRYRLDEIIGKGGMGVVYRATQFTVDGRQVAVKVLRRRLSDDLAMTARFQREIVAVKNLRHPHTLRVYEAGDAGEVGGLYIVTELLEGEPLSELMSRLARPMPLERAIDIVSKILRSLDEAHVAGVVHRDIKPRNIFLDRVHGERDFVRVIDFGLAQVPEAERAVDTLPGMLMGTPAYMSPEQAQGRPADARSDLYAVGVLFYELVCGQRPYPEGTQRQVLDHHLYSDPRPFPPEADVPDGVRAVILRLLAKRPSERFQTAQDVLAALGAESVSHSGVWRRPLAPYAGKRTDTAVTDDERSGWLGHWLAVAAAVALMVLAGRVAGTGAARPPAVRTAPSPASAPALAQTQGEPGLVAEPVAERIPHPSRSDSGRGEPDPENLAAVRPTRAPATAVQRAELQRPEVDGRVVRSSSIEAGRSRQGVELVGTAPPAFVRPVRPADRAEAAVRRPGVRGAVDAPPERHMVRRATVASGPGQRPVVVNVSVEVPAGGDVALEDEPTPRRKPRVRSKTRSKPRRTKPAPRVAPRPVVAPTPMVAAPGRPSPPPRRKPQIKRLPFD